MRLKFISLAAVILGLFSLSHCGLAYWIWTPESGKFVNPKYSARETDEKQFEWAMGFFKSEDYKRAIAEFEKLLKHYPLSKFAGESQFYIAESLYNSKKYYHAFKNYQTVIEKYPYSERVEEIIEKEYTIAGLFFSGQKAKILGFPVLPAKDKAIEIFSAVVSNAPYGKYADSARYKLGECYMDRGEYIDAALSFKEIIENYPKSPLVDDAKYKIAVAAAESTAGPEYNEEDTDRAIKEFKDFLNRFPQSTMDKEARFFLGKLENQKAESQFKIARFYEKQGNTESARIYYRRITADYPQSEWAQKAEQRLRLIREKD